MPHWYPEVFTSQHVRSFLSKHLDIDSNPPVVEMPKELILTVAIPTESGSLYGFRIQELYIPGR
ncbi:MAG TPA: hypothetical protein VGO47_07045 [Chlamydiales bacterium]|nr:hypothetical protein [Chlamydiales bacterium]